ncbi:MAG: hypothetical protein ACM3MH_02450 [Actinomycetota bacterium]
MPQPLSKFPKVHSIGFDTNALANKPDMAVLVANIFAASAQIDHELSLILVRLLGADETPALAMFGILESQSLQRKALIAAAQAHFEDEPAEFETFSAIISAVECAQADRHRIAHGVWAKSDQLPDALLVADTKVLKESTIALSQLKTARGPKAEEAVKKFASLFQGVYVYKKADLERVRRDLAEAEGIMSQYQIYLEPMFTEEHAAKFAIPVGTRAQALQKLSTSRLFRQALIRVRDKAAKNKPQSQCE